MPSSKRETLVLAAVTCGIFGLYGWAVFISGFGYDGSIGPRYNTPGTDWMVYHAAARAYLDGQLPLIFDAERFTAQLNTIHSGWLSTPLPFHPWLYPPSYLLLLVPFGALPFLASYGIFIAATFAALAAVIWHQSERGFRRWVQLIALLLSPAASLTVAMGQNAFLTSALLIGGFQLSGRRPILGGALLGVLTYKPQFWLLVPVALVASRQWRVLASAFATASLIALASLAVFGVDAWDAWFNLILNPPTEFFENWLEWSRLWGQSVYTCAVLLGASRSIANAAQLLALMLGAGSVYYAFSRPMARDLRLCVVLGATVLAAPHVSGYDTVLLAVAAAMMFCRRPDMPLSHLALLLGVWLIPLVNPPRAIPLGLLTPVLVCAFIAYAMAAGRTERRPGGAAAILAPPAEAGAPGQAV
jgi:alpha-1,2-mannosyltransferase